MTTQASDSKRLIAGLYNRAAPIYDRVGPPLFSEFGRLLVAAAGIRPGATILDVACGRGANLFATVERLGGSGTAVGVDLAFGMARETSSEIKHRAILNAHIAQMDGEQLAFADGMFDAVLCGFAIFWFVHQQQAFAEFFRVLKPGGTLALSLGAGEDERWQWYRELLARYTAAYGLNFEYGATGYVEPKVLLERIRAAGFSEAQSVEHAPEFVYRDEQEWWDGLWMHGSRSPLERMPAYVLNQFRQEVFAALTERRTAEGLRQMWRILLVTAAKPGSMAFVRT